MKAFVNVSIQRKILLLTLGLGLFTSVLIAAVIAYRDFNQAQKAFSTRLNLEVKIISDNLGSAVVFQDYEAIADTVASLSAETAILSVKVTDSSDELILAKEFQAQRGQSQTADFNAPILVDGERVGSLLVSTYNEDLARVLKDVFLTVAICLVFLLILVVALIMFLGKYISKPIVDLYHIAEVIGDTKNYSLRVNIQSGDEIGRLAEMFNYMLESIERRDENLEKQVIQRTLELEKLAEEFRHRAFHDSLTGLPNRALLGERFNLAVEHADRQQNMFGCLLLDLDNFKTINDTKGHNYGDKLLIEVAERLKATVRKEDFVSRLGGDEFVILLIDIDNVETLDEVLKKILASVSEDFYVNDELVKTGVSIGASIYPYHGSDINSVKRKADVAMYRAKDAGKNCFQIYSPEMQEDVKHRLMIQTDLQQAINEEELILYYQPKIDLKTKKIAGHEVLIRWQHPKEGFLTPAGFIPFAEETPLIIELDYYVLRKSCETLSRWQKMGLKKYSLAINLSGRHFTNFKIVNFLKDYICDYRIDPSWLEIEITEAVLINDPEVAQNVVDAIKSLGVRLSLDDFGTGYSSLNYIRTLPIDCVKLDPTFIRHIQDNEQDQKLISGIVSLGKSLNLEIVAEGVESFEQLVMLESFGCDYVQGYYFQKPVPEAVLLDWMKHFDYAHYQKS